MGTVSMVTVAATVDASVLALAELVTTVVSGTEIMRS